MKRFIKINYPHISKETKKKVVVDAIDYGKIKLKFLTACI
jgi:hypothetical protein